LRALTEMIDRPSTVTYTVGHVRFLSPPWSPA
jgi:hypothetical protein